MHTVSTSVSSATGTVRSVRDTHKLSLTYLKGNLPPRRDGRPRRQAALPLNLRGRYVMAADEGGRDVFVYITEDGRIREDVEAVRQEHAASGENDLVGNGDDGDTDDDGGMGDDSDDDVSIASSHVQSNPESLVEDPDYVLGDPLDGDEEDEVDHVSVLDEDSEEEEEYTDEEGDGSMYGD